MSEKDAPSKAFTMPLEKAFASRFEEIAKDPAARRKLGNTEVAQAVWVVSAAAARTFHYAEQRLAGLEARIGALQKATAAGMDTGKEIGAIHVAPGLGARESNAMTRGGKLVTEEDKRSPLFIMQTAINEAFATEEQRSAAMDAYLNLIGRSSSSGAGE